MTKIDTKAAADLTVKYHDNDFDKAIASVETSIQLAKAACDPKAAGILEEELGHVRDMQISQ